MRASEAIEIANSNNKMKKPLREILSKIKKAAKQGKFEIDKVMVGDYGTFAYELKTALTDLGYSVGLTSEQTDPNSSDYFLHISWED